jgi:prepilin-type N-terminal cleavage/methylation domain-containing protein
MSKQELKQKGFTIIEVVLVLAIAALIFLMVFIALPALQRNQRDTQRRNDVGRFVSQVSNYSTNNKGKIPVEAGLPAFVTNYLKGGTGGEFNDPKTGDPYVVAWSLGAPTEDGRMYYYAGATCDGETIVSSTGSRMGAVAVKLEGSGVFCQETKS